MEDLTDALDGRRIFWMGCIACPPVARVPLLSPPRTVLVLVPDPNACRPDYDAAKKRKANIEALKLLTPDSAGPDEIEIDSLIIALREAEVDSPC